MNLAGNCSCPRCDFAFCFAKRPCNICVCDDCRSKTCIVNKTNNNNKLNQITSVYLNPARLKLAPKRSEELTDIDINYESDRNTIIKKNQSPPKSLDEYIDRHFFKIPSESIGIKHESLSGYIDLISGKNAQALENYIQKLKVISFQKIQDVEQEPNINVKTFKCYDNCRSNYVGRRERKYTKHRDEDRIINGKSNETEVRSVMLSSTNIDFNLSNKQLNYRSSDTKDSSDSLAAAANSIFKFDIFTKIKEAYKACSCIVCECIPSMKNQNDVCKCKPCECADCTSYMAASESYQLAKEKVGSKYTASKYIISQSQEPEIDCCCKPCDCALCHKIHSAKLYDCDKCLCEERKPNVSKGLPNRGQYKSTPCQCTPCNCTECVRDYMNVSRNSASRKVNTPCPYETGPTGIEACTCEQHGTVLNMKPANKLRQNLDMQTDLILNDIYHNNDGTNKSQDLIAMYSALPYNHKYSPKKIDTIACYCDDCKCASCVCKDDTINAIKSSQLFICHKIHSRHHYNKPNSTKHSIARICDCAPCECQMCANRVRKESFNNGTVSYKKNTAIYSCKCDAYFCSETFPQSSKQYETLYKCDICRCERHFGEECMHPVCHILNRSPIKKGEVLTTWAHQIKDRKQKLTKPYLLANNVKDKLPVDKNTDAGITSQVQVNNYRCIETNSYLNIKSKPYLANRSKTKVDKTGAEYGTGFFESLNECDIFKYDTYVQHRLRNRITSDSHENNITDKIFQRYNSIYPSTESISKPSLSKENDTSTSTLDKDKSSENSGNNSTYDHSWYMKKLPNTTTKPYLEDFGNYFVN